MIEKILPAGVSYAEEFKDLPAAEIFPEEAAIVSNAVEQRRREFATGRHCAHEALLALGCTPTAIRKAPSGAPVWPAGIAGSITHCRGYRAAVVTRLNDIAGIGIDAEPNEPLPPGVLNLISLAGERAMLHTLSAQLPAISWERLLFSAKESVYKAWFPLTGRWLDFSDAAVRIDPVSATFNTRLIMARAAASPPIREFNGHWLASGELILTASMVPSTQSLK